MGLLNTIFCAVSILALVPQIAYAQKIQPSRKQAEAGYLHEVEQLLDKSNSYALLSINAGTSTRGKLSYGYQTCDALDRGMTSDDLSHAGFTIAQAHHNPDEALYFDAMRVAAVFHLCPKYKSRL